MGYKFQKGEPVADGVVRISVERLKNATRALDHYPDPDPEGLHTARKDIKKVRSLLRLIRVPDLKAFRKPLNAELREIGLHLSGHRDAEVLNDMMEKWLNKIPEDEEEPALRESIARLAEHFKGAGDIHPPLDAVLESSVKKRLNAVATEIQDADLSGLDREAILKAARRRAKRMRKAHRAYVERPDTDHLHEWRKQAKNHLYHLRLLKQVDPPQKGYLKKIKKLENRLGKARDHDLLLETLRNDAHPGLGVAELGKVMRLAERRKENLLRKALKVADGLP